MPEPVIDPKTGEPITPTPTPPPAEGDFVPKAEFDELKAKLDAFEQGFNMLRSTQPQPTPAAPAPTGPTLADQISTIDADIKPLNKAIDDAIADGKPVSTLMTKRDELVQKRNRLQIQHEDIDPLRNFAATNIDALSATVTSTKENMPYLDLVKDEMDTMLNQLQPEQRANPQIRLKTYEMAVGANLPKILEAQKEEILRATTTDTPDTTTSSRGQSYKDSAGNAIPAPKEVLSANALNAIRAKGQTVDEYYKRLGYDGWADFYEKTGKEHFSDEEE